MEDGKIVGVIAQALTTKRWSYAKLALERTGLDNDRIPKSNDAPNFVPVNLEDAIITVQEERSTTTPSLCWAVMVSEFQSSAEHVEQGSATGSTTYQTCASLHGKMR